jgi:hypothetical protein
MNELVVAGRSLVVLGKEPDLIDASLGIQLTEVGRDIERVEQEIDGLEVMIGKSLNQLCWMFPELSDRFRDRYNKFLELRGEEPVDKNVDPASRADRDGKNPAKEAAKAEEEAEEEARRKLQESDDSELSPVQRQAKLSVRIKREKCRKFYQQISKKTHPDKVKDQELNEIFIKAKKAYEQLDLDELREMFKDLEGFLKLRGNRGAFRNYRIRRLEVSRMYLDDRKHDLKKLKSGIAYECYEALSSGDREQTREVYQDYIEEQLIMVDSAIDQLRVQMRAKRSRVRPDDPNSFKMPQHLKEALMGDLFSDN